MKFIIYAILTQRARAENLKSRSVTFEPIEKITYQCKIIIIPEEGWFGQPKYSTHKKDPSTLCRLLLLFSSIESVRFFH